MSLGEWLLVGLIIATLVGAGVGAGITLYRHKSQVKWRKLDRLTPFIRSWREQVDVLGIGAASTWTQKEFRLYVEDDGCFGAALALSKEVQGQYEEFKTATSRYIKACCELFDNIAQDCQDKTGLPIGEGHEKEWPENVITPAFVGTINKFVTTRDQTRLIDKDVSYNIRSFHRTGGAGDWERKGLELRLTSAILEFENKPIAQVSESEEALLKQIEPIHREMMSAEYARKFEEKVNEIWSLKDRAESLAEQVRSGLLQLETS